MRITEEILRIGIRDTQGDIFLGFDIEKSTDYVNDRRVLVYVDFDYRKPVGFVESISLDNNVVTITAMIYEQELSPYDIDMKDKCLAFSGISTGPRFSDCYGTKYKMVELTHVGLIEKDNLVRYENT